MFKTKVMFRIVSTNVLVYPTLIWTAGSQKNWYPASWHSGEECSPFFILLLHGGLLQHRSYSQPAQSSEEHKPVTPNSLKYPVCPVNFSCIVEFCTLFGGLCAGELVQKKRLKKKKKPQPLAGTSNLRSFMSIDNHLQTKTTPVDSKVVLTENKGIHLKIF